MSDDPRLSDEATGLPPLEVIEQEGTVVVLAYAASEGVSALTLDDKVAKGTEQAVRYLHVRGIAASPDGGVEWVQCHLAVPVECALDVAAALAKGTTEDIG